MYNIYIHNKDICSNNNYVRQRATLIFIVKGKHCGNCFIRSLNDSLALWLLNICAQYKEKKKSKQPCSIRVILPQGYGEKNSTEEKEVKGKSRRIVRRWERKRPCCFDDFSRRGNVPRLRGRFVASHASGPPISRATRYIESQTTKQPPLHNNMYDRRKSDGRKSAIIYHSLSLSSLSFFFEKLI